MARIKISKDFSEYPGARYNTDGPFSGEAFYETILSKAFQESLDAGDKLIVDLDDTAGYASSFLSESFGLLAKAFTPQLVLDKIVIVSKQEPDWRDRILNDYIPNGIHRKDHLVSAK